MTGWIALAGLVLAGSLLLGLLIGPLLRDRRKADTRPAQGWAADDYDRARDARRERDSEISDRTRNPYNQRVGDPW